MKFPRWYSRQRGSILLAACLTLVLLSNFPALPSRPALPKARLKHPPESPLDPTSSRPTSHSKARVNGCAAYPDAADVVIIVKTGATEVSSKLPMLLATFLQCAPADVLVFSDMEQMLGDRRVYDALDEVVEKAIKGNPDFELYRAQAEYRTQGEYVFSMGDRAGDAWKLDKYKNIHTARKAWHLRPDRSWYFFIDADTYVFWPNFFQLLTHYDPEKRWYIGSRVNDGLPPFAHGGSGYLLSRAAMAELVGDDEKEVAERYDLEAVTGCCGDQELARTLEYKNITITNVWPILQGNQATGLNFGPLEWCQPIVSLHHMNNEVINDVWQFESQREDSSEILTIEDFYQGYIEPQIQAYRNDWDNGAADILIKPPSPDSPQPKRSSWWEWNRPYKSYNLCDRACREEPDCYMFRHHGETCSLARSWKLGGKKLPVEGVVWKSGWNLNRIAQFKIEKSPCRAPLWDPVAP